MKKTYLAMVVAAASMVAAPALAQDYQVEAGVVYTNLSPDLGSSDRQLGVDFRYNFEAVSTAGKPLAEAQFLGRNGGVEFGYSDQKDTDNTNITVGGDYWFNDVYFSASFVNADDGDDKENVVGAKAGYMLDKNLLVHVGLANQGYVAGKGVVSDETTVSVGGKYIATLDNNLVNLETEFVRNSDYKSLTVSGDYFITNDLSAGIGATKISGGDEIAVDFGIKYFAEPTLSGEVAFTLNDGGVDKDQAVSFRIAARF